jgi:hypothetical protein
MPEYRPGVLCQCLNFWWKSLSISFFHQRTAGDSSAGLLRTWCNNRKACTMLLSQLWSRKSLLAIEAFFVFLEEIDVSPAFHLAIRYLMRLASGFPGEPSQSSRPETDPRPVPCRRQSQHGTGEAVADVAFASSQAFFLVISTCAFWASMRFLGQRRPSPSLSCYRRPPNDSFHSQRLSVVAVAHF